jgi:hypothetical protein
MLGAEHAAAGFATGPWSSGCSGRQCIPCARHRRPPRPNWGLGRVKFVQGEPEPSLTHLQDDVGLVLGPGYKPTRVAVIDVAERDAGIAAFTYPAKSKQ